MRIRFNVQSVHVAILFAVLKQTCGHAFQDERLGACVRVGSFGGVHAA